MTQVRKVIIRAIDKDGPQERLRVNIEATIVIQPGRLTKDEVNRMKKTLADKLMTLLAHEVPHLHVHLSDLKVTR